MTMLYFLIYLMYVLHLNRVKVLKINNMTLLINRITVFFIHNFKRKTLIQWTTNNYIMLFI